MRRISPLVSLLPLLLVAPGVQALELADHMYVVVSAGGSKFNVSALRESLDKLMHSQHPRLWQNKAQLDGSDLGYKLQIGHEFSPHWAIEGGYVDLGRSTYQTTYSYTLTNPIVIAGRPLALTRDAPASQREIRIHGWNVAALGRMPLGEAFSVFGKLGFLRATVATRDSGDAFGSKANITANTWVANYGLGAGYRLNETLGLRAEFERFAKVGKDDSTGRADVDWLTVGVSARF